MQTPIEALVELVLRQQEIIQQPVAEVERLKTNASREVSEFVLTAIK